MLKVLLDRLGKPQSWVSEASNIHKNRISDLVHNRDVPKPDEIVAIDRALNQNRRLVLHHCSKVCPAGIYAGYQFTDMDLPTAGMRLIGALTTIDRLLPQIVDMLCEGRLSQEVVAKLGQLRLSIMALEVQLSTDKKTCSSGELRDIREFRQRKKDKENATARTVATCK